MDLYQELCQRAESRRYQVKLNDRRGWFSSRWEALNDIYKGQSVDYLFEVYIQCDHHNAGGSLAPLETQNLIYFFVRTDQALQRKLAHGEDASFHLVIFLMGGKKDVQENRGRLQAFLQLQAALRTHNRFYIATPTDDGQDWDYVSLPAPGEKSAYTAETPIGKLPPLLSVAFRKTMQDAGVSAPGSPPETAASPAKEGPHLAYEDLLFDSSLNRDLFWIIFRLGKRHLLAGSTLRNAMFALKWPIIVQKWRLLRKPLPLRKRLKRETAPFKKQQKPFRPLQLHLRIFKEPLALRQLQLLCANYLLAIILGIKSPSEGGMSPKEKSRCCDELETALRKCLFYDKTATCTSLSQLLFFIILNYLQEQKLLLNPKDREKQRTVSPNGEVIEKSAIDAVEYAEGLLQLLENSCSHTQTGIGYLSIRIHYINRNCSESDLVSVAQRRAMLMELYDQDLTKSHPELVPPKKQESIAKSEQDDSSDDTAQAEKQDKKPDKRIRLFPERFEFRNGAEYYLEFFLADDAYRLFQDDQGRDRLEVDGIPKVFYNNHSDVCKRTPDLAYIFNSEYDKDLKMVAIHYGIRQFKKIVLRNYGCFMVRSPSMDHYAETEIYSAFISKSTDSRDSGKAKASAAGDFYRQKLGSGWQQLVLNESCRATEYRILLPCGDTALLMPPKFEKTDKPLSVPEDPLDLIPLRSGDNIAATDFQSMKDVFQELGDRDSADDNLKSAVKKLLSHFTDSAESRTALTQTEKRSVVESSAETLERLFKSKGSAWRKITQDLSRTILCIDLWSLHENPLLVELAAKAIMYLIGKLQRAEDSGSSAKAPAETPQLLFAVFFKNTAQMRQFIMAYTSFYDEEGLCAFMDRVQIAICGYNSYQKDDSEGVLYGDEPGTFPEVSFLLSGKNLASVWRTADIFAFNNDATNTMHLLPHLRYLSEPADGSDQDGGKLPPPFPFDLYLTRSPVHAQKKIQRDESSCWFLQQISAMVANDIRKEKLGCKIENVHVRLGSRIHIEDFYEAEMLFQNVRVVMRFAYLIVEQILYRLDGSRPVLIVGYEPYSTVLMEYVSEFLRRCLLERNLKGTVAYGLYGHDADGDLSFRPSAKLQLLEHALPDQLDYVTVYPIGTTLSTIYQMQNAVQAYFDTLDRKLWNKANICVLLIGDAYNDALSPSKQYWTKLQDRDGMTGLREGAKDTVRLTDDRNQSEKVLVRFFLEAKTKWHEPEECTEGIKRQDNTLVYVDPTSTIPSSIFPLVGRKADGPISFVVKNDKKDAERIKQNNDRLKLLHGCVHYGHIRVGNNHFQYHIDLPRYLQNVLDKQQSELEKTLEEWKDSVDPEAYNIIAAPLEQENAAFLRLIVDKVFAHSIRIIRIPFLSARKEDIRAKYSYISSEYRQIKKANPKTKINVYFVTMSIVTGESFYRAQKLVGMLLEDSGMLQHDRYLFAGIFALLNRSSKSTIQTMVEDSDRGFHAYLHLAVPHYNTSQGKCPACYQYERNARMMERCATNKAQYSLQDTVEFSRLRTTDEYLQWRTKRIWTSRSEFELLKLWLEMNENSTAFLEDFPGLSREDAAKLHENCKAYLRQERKEMSAAESEKGELGSEITQENNRRSAERYYVQHARQDLTKSNITPETVERFWIDGAVQDLAFRRIMCTHQAYFALESQEIREADLSKLEDKTVEALLRLLCLIQKPRQRLSDAQLFERMEDLISYIKVISREYLSKHHYIRSAMFQIMSVMLRLVFGCHASALSKEFPIARADEINTRIIKPSLQASPYQRYRLMMTLLNQLSIMEANDVLSDSTLENLLKQVAVLRAYKIEDDRISIPSDETVEDEYLRCIKKRLLIDE